MKTVFSLIRDLQGQKQKIMEGLKIVEPSYINLGMVQR